MKTISLLCGICWFPLLLGAQFIADFSETRLDTEVWSGDTANFVINPAQELQLIDEDPVQTSSFLVARVATGDSTHWDFLVRQEFNPSSTNFARVYLAASDSVLTEALNGYHLDIGGTSGSVDSLQLYRQDGSSSSLILAGRNGAVATEPEVRIRVSRNAAGLWRLAADYGGGNNFEDEGSATDATYPTGTYFGMVCRYTSTRTDKIFFDDIRIDPLFVDTRGPTLLNLTVRNAQEIELQFDEDLDPLSAATVANYQIDNGIQITAASLVGGNPRLVRLELASPLVSLQTYLLTVAGVRDSKGNPQDSQSLDFVFLDVEEAMAFDVLITEIFPDPTPVIGLPETEYLELYNRSDKLIDLENYLLADASAEVILPPYLLLPDAYVILYKSGTGDFAVFGDSLPLPDFPALTNGGEVLQLLNPSGALIHRVAYTDAWYRNTDRDDGGWSLELINPNALCAGASNWIVSESLLGGTPGQENSVFATNTEIPALELLQVAPLFGGVRVRLLFNVALDVETAADPSNYQIEGLSIIAAIPDPDFNRSVLLQMAEPLAERTIYEIQVLPGLTDCQGRSSGVVLRGEFGLAELIEERDLVINEVLFDPEVGGVDFVELFNRSDKVLNLGNLLVANRDDSLRVAAVRSIPEDYPLFPGRYVVLTPDPEDIRMRYAVEDPRAFIRMILPTFPNDEGRVVLFENQGNTTLFVDELAYRDRWHNELLADREGVSLERISPEGPTQEESNWESAAQTAGFATPTFRNSQFGEELATGSELITLPYTTFSPDSDGFRDALLLRYQTPEAGYLANVRIFDARGRLVRDLSENDLLGRSGTIRWDGADADGAKAKVGIYLLWIELFSPAGDVERIRENCVLGGE
ncbi:MAG: lamin tail domain-containing protein [Bacteroidota bacterium]